MADDSPARMTDAELEHAFGLPPGYMATAPADLLESLEAVRQEAERLVSDRVRELIEGVTPSAPPVGLMNWAKL